jgi:hypothetical protein
MNKADVNLEQWARRAAEDLREFAAAGREACSPMESTEALIAEIERVIGPNHRDTPEAPTCIQPQ